MRGRCCASDPLRDPAVAFIYLTGREKGRVPAMSSSLGQGAQAPPAAPLTGARTPGDRANAGGGHAGAIRTLRLHSRAAAVSRTERTFMVLSLQLAKSSVLPVTHFPMHTAVTGRTLQEVRQRQWTAGCSFR